MPQPHAGESKSVINLTMLLVATMTALVLGLLIGEAHSSYQAQVTGLEKMSADIIVVDRLMARIGPAAIPVTAAMREEIPAIGETPLACMVRVMRDDGIDPERRDRMAVAAARLSTARSSRRQPARGTFWQGEPGRRRLTSPGPSPTASPTPCDPS
jgi:hypothetical protein